MITPEIPPLWGKTGYIGGGETYPINLALALAKANHHVTLVTSGGSQGKEANFGDNLRIVWAKSITSIPFRHQNPLLLKIRPLLNEDYEIVHVHQLRTISSVMGCGIAKIRKKPSILTDHGGGSRAFFPSPFLPARFPDAFAAVSHFSSNWFKYLAPKASNFVIYGGVDTGIFHPQNNLETLRQGLKTEGYHIILYVGRVLPYKGIDVLIGALRYLPLNTKLLIVGPCIDKACLEYLKGLASNISPNRVHFLGAVKDEELPLFFNICDVFVMPTVNIDYLGRYHPFPEFFNLSTLEAIACGKPVVVSNTGGLPESIFNGENGFVVKQRDEKQLAHAIEILLEDEKLRTKMGVAGLKWIQKEFTWSMIATKVVRVYETVLREQFSHQK